MSRTYFPTYSLNRFGVRVTGQRATLGAASSDRFYQEPAPRAAMTPTRPILGAVAPIYPTSEMIRVGTFWDGYPQPGPMPVYPGPFPNLSDRPAPTAPANPPIFNPPPSATGGGGATPGPASPSGGPVSSQIGPTPTATTPPPTQIVPVLVSSGGGVATPSTPTVTAPAASSGSLVDSLAGWLGRSTTILNYPVPNALLAGIVVLGFAWLSSGKKR